MESRFQVGETVCLRADPARLGAVLQVLPGASGHARYRVFHSPQAIREYYEDQLRPSDLPHAADATLNALGGVPSMDSDTFRARLTAARLSRPQIDTLYALHVARIQYIPFQIKPLLRFLRADRPHLLVADEVGVGKTIEAGLILFFRAALPAAALLGGPCEAMPRGESAHDKPTTPGTVAHAAEGLTWDARPRGWETSRFPEGPAARRPVPIRPVAEARRLMVEPRPLPQPHESLCSCGGRPKGGRPLLGHDARLKGALLRCIKQGDEIARDDLRHLCWEQFAPRTDTYRGYDLMLMQAHHKVADQLRMMVRVNGAGGVAPPTAGRARNDHAVTRVACHAGCATHNGGTHREITDGMVAGVRFTEEGDGVRRDSCDALYTDRLRAPLGDLTASRAYEKLIRVS